MRRMLLAATAAVALSVPASVATVVSSTNAWAISSVTCNTMTGKASGVYNFRLKACSPPMAEHTIHGVGTDLTKVGGPITYTWKWNGGATTVVSLTVVHTGTCPAGYFAYTDTGSVTGGTSTYTQVGDSIQINVCKKFGAPHMYKLELAVGSVASL